ncbi:hypothetical protein [Shewanella waksmanii]|uniref:hypothetical protein n=1 Tax=Shewanella waksmanii TaxID=213783 RepID=UPI003734CEA8
MRILSTVTSNPRLEKVPEVNRSKRVQNENIKTRRVKDVKKADKKYKKTHRVFRVPRKFDLNNRQLGIALKQYQLRALQDPNGLAGTVTAKKQPTAVEECVCSSLLASSYLYPKELVEALEEFVATNQINHNDDVKLNSEVLQQSVAYENRMEVCLFLLDLCRTYKKSESQI